MPKWQPMQDLPLLGAIYDMPWWQWALFVDAGRVSGSFSLKDLHTDIKASAGIGEDWFWRVFINQPF
ncbi:hypothetical protein ACH42_01135 [Endozoicomonas sp. (ex Bugula neritina AB1)]|nr:hypothetical protein ACH42_01135 [Endozoicomonas sp. (ex Bugula neritina AB1)]